MRAALKQHASRALETSEDYEAATRTAGGSRGLGVDEVCGGLDTWTTQQAWVVVVVVVVQDIGGYSEFGLMASASDAAIRRWRGDPRHLRQGAGQRRDAHKARAGGQDAALAC